LIGILVLASGCIGTAAQQPGRSAGSPVQPASAKVLTWAVDDSPKDVLALSGVGGTRGLVSAFRQIAHARLAKEDFALTAQPELAVEMPSAEKGTWRLNPDGTMETIWKLRPNAKWHDGTPFTAADLVFWFSVLRDPFLPSVSVTGLREVAGTSAPDPLTFVIQWSQVNYRADVFPDVGPLPRHLLEDLYGQRDAEAFLNSRYFSTDFVGLGPYRLVRWDPGSDIEFTRFDDYVLGPPLLDRVILRTISDYNTMLSGVLAGAVDLANPPGDLVDVADLNRRWEGTGNRVRADANDRIHMIYQQLRPGYARPLNGFTDRRLRQALYHATDSSSVAEVAYKGLSPVADSWIAPSSPIRREVESSIPRYPHDPAVALQLMAQAGWVRGADGILVHRESGDRFELDLRSRSGRHRELLVLADQWKAIGIEPTVTTIPPARIGDREYLATWPGVSTSRLETNDTVNTRRLHSQDIAGPANRWAGRNLAGYSNPRADALQERLVATIDRTEHIRLQRELLQEMLGDVAFIPMFWDLQFALITRQLKGDVSAVETGWNLVTWDRE